MMKRITAFRFILPMLAATLASVVLAALRHEPALLGRYLALIVLAGCAVAIGLHSQRAPRTAALAVSATVVTVLLSVLLSFRWPPGSRPSSWVGGPNETGAVIAVLMMLGAIYGARLPSWGIYLVGIIAVFATGSRTALLAVLSGILVRGLRDRRHTGLAVFGIVAALAVGLLCELQSSVVRETHNLLVFSDNIASPVWYKGYDKKLDVRPAIVAGPFGESGAQWIRGQTDLQSKYPRILITQGIGVSRLGEKYIASVYLRATEPAVLWVGSNLTSAPCHVESAWTRCTTPPRTGDGTTSVAFQLQTDRPGEAFDFEIWGAQLETGEVPTTAEPTQSNLAELLSYYYPKRLNPLLATPASGLLSRYEIWKQSAKLFREAPLAGLGEDRLRALLRKFTESRNLPAANHAHNEVLQLAAADGVLGLLIWTIVALGFGGQLTAMGRIEFLPVIVVVGVLNAFDATFFTTVEFATFWFAMGTSIGRHGPPSQK